MFDELMEKIENKTALLGVVGMGYVGLPLAVEEAEAGYRVLGFDTDPAKVEQLRQGESYVGDVPGGQVSRLVVEGKLIPQGDFSTLSRCDCVAICVPTPLDTHHQPDITCVLSATREVARHAHPNMLVVLESTTYPGTTEEVLVPIFEEAGFRVGQDIFLAFSPERVDPGNKEYNTRNTPKVVGGVTAGCTALATRLYEQVLEAPIFSCSSPKVAEMEKILENTFRNLNIALANEMAVLCHKMDIPVWEVVDAAATKPYGFMPFYPGPGLGGHCIPIDPFYLTWKAKEVGHHTRLIEAAGDINCAMPAYVVERMSRILNRHRLPLNGSKILLLGMAYKANISDLRESPALEVLHLLEKAGADVSVNDPYVPEFWVGKSCYQSVPAIPQVLGQYDMVVVLAAHSQYNLEELCAASRLVFDTRGLGRGKNYPNLVRL